MKGRFLFATVLGLMALVWACGRHPVSTTSTPPSNTAASPEASSWPWGDRRLRTESYPYIRAVSPETVPFSDNQASVGTFHVTYEIERPELLTNARLELRSNHVLGAYMDVPIQAHGEADLKAEGAVTIGPTVKFQLQCPSGETNWLAIGALRPAASSALPRIEDITPDHVPEESDQETVNGGADARVRFLLFGAGFEPDCKARFTVNNGQPNDAPTIFWGPKQIYADITRRPLSPFDWSEQRYLELRLVTERRAPDWTPKRHSYLDVKAYVWLIPVVEE